ncbi:hypothetical protein B0T24DRAFT_519407 [Lasiosphaeria ovina]|uniref:Peptidase A1 domain-containing protein n=1 Tax=Lasiosphaeria ovina TaxID=92902 RepID=A0AAE0NIF7_9PEZI|nr:hypothetical protein B0T24DRAFT_519407 [Lasiosphaeria ovina]
MADDITRDLVVALQSISYSGSTSATLLSSPIDIFIDSTDPYIWLPADACDAFEEAFGLRLDSKSGLYLVNDTHRAALLDSKAEVSFRLSDVKSGGDTVTITLPYDAFDLTADYPLVDNRTYYFPLRRANNPGQYTLGRTFLQEAYLSADYERKTFNVSACIWDQGAKQTIITIPSTEFEDSNPTSAPPTSNSSGLSGGAIAGIVAASVIVGILVFASVIVIILRKRRKWLSAGFAVMARDSPPDESILKGPVFNSPSRQASTPDGSMPFSADDISANQPQSTSTSEHARLGSGIVGESITGALSISELDGHETLIRPNKELDGNEVQRPLPTVAESPGGVYELPGSDAPTRQRIESLGDKINKGTASTISSLRSRDGGEEEGYSPPSPLISTMATN